MQLGALMRLSASQREAFIESLSAEEARLLLQEVERHESTVSNEPILDFMVRVSPRLHRADHFRIYADKLEHGVGGGLRIVFAAPPQHGKSSTTLHGLAWAIKKYPGKRHAYVTYSQTRARSVARTVRRILTAAGVAVSGTLHHFILPGGGQCLFTSIDGGITGEPVDGIAVIDDPFKNRKEADSSGRRDVVESAYREAIETRIHPGASIFLLATRWHPQDLSGRLIADGWEYINLPAIAEGANDPNGRQPGEALFPQMWPLESLLEKKRKVLDFAWNALYQGRPRPKGGKVFHEPQYYRELPKRYRGAYGVDLAYTAKSSADWSVNVELWREERDKLEPLYYVIWVDREQVEAPEFTAILERRIERRKFPMRWRASGTERGSAQFIVNRGVPLRVTAPPGDKLVSATDVAAAWNDGRVLVPDSDVFPDCEQWLGPFLDVLANFTGLGKELDDDVDALGNAFEELKVEIDMSVHRSRSSR